VGKIKEVPIKRYIGGKEYAKFKAGGSLTRKNAILAHCYECTAGYDEGKSDCNMSNCPLYQFHPYKGLKKEIKLC
jgi:hypothetical protein